MRRWCTAVAGLVLLTLVTWPTFLEGQMPPARADTGSTSQTPSSSITISFDGTPVGNVMAAFARHGDFSFVLGTGVEGRITADVREVPWELALEAVLEAHGFQIRSTAGGIRIVESREAALTHRTFEEPQTRVFHIRFQRADEVAPIVQSVLSDRGSLAVAGSANALVVTDLPAVLQRIKVVLGG